MGNADWDFLPRCILLIAENRQYKILLLGLSHCCSASLLVSQDHGMTPGCLIEPESFNSGCTLQVPCSIALLQPIDSWQLSSIFPLLYFGKRRPPCPDLGRSFCSFPGGRCGQAARWDVAYLRAGLAPSAGPGSCLIPHRSGGDGHRGVKYRAPRIGWTSAAWSPGR